LIPHLYSCAFLFHLGPQVWFLGQVSPWFPDSPYPFQTSAPLHTYDLPPMGVAYPFGSLRFPKPSNVSPSVAKPNHTSETFSKPSLFPSPGCPVSPCFIPTLRLVRLFFPRLFRAPLLPLSPFLRGKDQPCLQVFPRPPQTAKS